MVAAAERADLRELWRAIGALPRQQRRAILLREFSGLSYDELAAALGVSEPAVESLLFRARRELRTRLRPVYGSVVIAPLNAVRDALAPVAVKLGAGATAVVVAGGTVAAVETHTLRRELAVQPAVASVLPDRARPVAAAPVPQATPRDGARTPSLTAGSGSDAPLHTGAPATGARTGCLRGAHCRSAPRPPRLSHRRPRRPVSAPAAAPAAAPPEPEPSAGGDDSPGDDGSPATDGDDGTPGTPSSGDGGTSSGEGSGGVDDHSGLGGGGDDSGGSSGSGGGGDDGGTSGSSGPGGGGDDAVSDGSAALAAPAATAATTASPRASFRPRAPRSRAPRRSPGAAR